MIRKILSYCTGLCVALAVVLGASSCSNDEGGDSTDQAISALYKISGRVVAGQEGGKGIAGVRVELTPEKGVVLDDENSVATSDKDGYFEVEVLSGNVKADVFVLDFTDPAGKYKARTLKQPIQDVEFENGDGLLYYGEYAMSLHEVVMALAEEEN